MLLTHSALNQLSGLQVTACVSGVFAWLFFFFFLSPSLAFPVSITSSLAAQGHWMSVSLVFLLSPQPRLHRVQSCWESVVDYRPLTLTCVRLCPQILHLISRVHTPAGIPMCTRCPLAPLQPLWLQKTPPKNPIGLFVSGLPKPEQWDTSCRCIRTHSQTVFFLLSIRLKLTVFTLASPSGSAGYIINPPLQFTGATC